MVVVVVVVLAKIMIFIAFEITNFAILNFQIF